MITKNRATVADLYNVPENGKAEIVNGELILMSPTGVKPGRAGGKIYASLLDFEEVYGGGYALPDNVGFVVDLPGRRSFSPDAAWYVGDPDVMSFGHGAPVFAVEVRSEGDYSPKAEVAISDKIADYFAAGTRVVWDVDLLSPDVIRSYNADSPTRPSTFRKGDVAHAEPAVSGWTFTVDRLLK